MNKYSNINGKVEITTQLRLSECKRLYSAPLMGIKLNLSKATFGSLLLLSLISSSFDLFGQGALFFSHPLCPPCALAKCCYGN